MQTNVTIVDRNIYGTLHKLTSGALVTTWGEGYFLALDFSNIPNGATVKVGLDPSQGSGYVELDEDHNGVFKITDKSAQKFKVLTTLNGVTKTDTYRLNNLVLEE